MSLGLYNVANLYYQRYANQQNKAVNRNNNIDFSSALSAKKAENMGTIQAAEETSTSKVDVYQKYLEQKYGNVRIENVGKDQQSLDKIAKTMRGNDVIIAPNIFEEMANDTEKAAYYEEKIDHFFNDIIPRETARCAAMGLDFQACGVVIHEDGTVTYICGCADSPERVAEVNKINKAKREKEVAQIKANMERSMEAAEKYRTEMKILSQKQIMEEAIKSRITDSKVSPQVFVSAVTAYDKNFMYIQ